MVTREEIDACYTVILGAVKGNREAVLALIEMREMIVSLAEDQTDLYRKIVAVINDNAARRRETKRLAKPNPVVRQFKRDFLQVLDGGKKD